APLPVALKTAMAWLEQEDEQKALIAARRGYDGDDFNYAGERSESGALARQFPEFDALVADDTFFDWCKQLYAPLKDLGPQRLKQEDHP
ncbi:MAG: hypothetical protein GYB38_03180, partial [Gammaproteobacteria bacterium]|nr:hypothetical protein [Gammaproteobacteria bacterium]